MGREKTITEQEYEEGLFKEINASLFLEGWTKDSGKALAKGILQDIENLTNVETSNSVVSQYGRILQIRARLKNLLEHCDEAEVILNQIKRRG